MKLHVEDIMRKGEKTLWTGTPESFSILSKVMARELIVKCIVIPAICIGVGILHVTNVGQPNTGLFWFMAIVCIAVIATAMFKRPKVMHQKYYMTDQRIIMIRGADAYYMDLDQINGYRLVTGKSDYPSIVFGKKIFADIKSHLLWRACADVETTSATSRDVTGRESQGLVFFNVKNAGDLDQLLKKANVPAA